MAGALCQPKRARSCGTVKSISGPIGTMPVGIHLTLAAVIVPLDLIDADGLGNAGHGIKIAQIIPQVGIVGDAAQIAFEMAVIDGVETDERGEQPPIRFSDLAADQITLPRFAARESQEN